MLFRGECVLDLVAINGAFVLFLLFRALIPISLYLPLHLLGCKTRTPRPTRISASRSIST